MTTYDAFVTLSGTVTTSAAATLLTLGATASQITMSRKAIVTAGANPIRFTLSGTTPTSTVGHYVEANGNVVLEGRQDIESLKLLAVGGESVVTVTLQKKR